ncbi:MAG: hypothetical protein N0C91_13095, partial [Candidatus Thiodiazotropha endolucinida]|nr:hypothetical protein [Candidatus Thiodiazotropha taylori]MCW4288638.1 hypothetical protein [Candidatus Thiodiazotropha endolucinida]
ACQHTTARSAYARANHRASLIWWGRRWGGTFGRRYHPQPVPMYRQRRQPHEWVMTLRVSAGRRCLR